MTTTNTPKPPRQSRRRTLLTGAFASMAGLVGGIAHARPGFGRNRHRGFGMRMFHMLEQLDLTEEQEVELVRLRRNLRGERGRIHDTAKEVIATISSELSKAQPNRRLIHEQLDTATTNVQKMMHLVADKFLDFHSKLSNEQRSQLSRAIEKKQRFMRTRMERFGQ